MMIKVGPALAEHADQLERERGIPRDVIYSSLKEAMLAAYKRYAHLTDTEGFICKLNERSGEIGIFQLVSVVAEIDPDLEAHQMVLKDALKVKADAEVGEVLEIDVTPDEFGRIAAQSAKQVITQRIREAEKMLVMKEFEEKKDTVTTGIVQRIEGRNIIVSIGRSEALMPSREQLPGEYYRVGNKLRVFVLDVRDSGRVPQILFPKPTQPWCARSSNWKFRKSRTAWWRSRTLPARPATGPRWPSPPMTRTWTPKGPVLAPAAAVSRPSSAS